MSERTKVLFAFRELVNAHRAELAAPSPASTARCSTTHGRGPARHSRWSSSPAASASCSRATCPLEISRGVDSYSLRQPVGVARASRRSISRSWCRCGCSRWRSRAATRSCSSPPSRTRRRRCGWPSCWTRPACPTACSTSCTATRRRSTRSSTHPGIDAVSFVGSTPIAKYIYETAAKHGKRVQALGGAKNHAVVLPDADLDFAADGLVSARLRLGGRALHGGVGGGRGGRRGRSARGQAQRADRRPDRGRRHRGGSTWARW